MDIEKGKKIFEGIPDQIVPSWAGTILYLFDASIHHVPKQVSALYIHINDPTSWKKAHGQFTEIRRFHLANPHFKPINYIFLAENVAKVIYNASEEPAPFDADSGWYIPQLAVEVANTFANKELSDKLDLLLFMVST